MNSTRIIRSFWVNFTCSCRRHFGLLVTGICLAGLLLRLLNWVMEPELSRDSIFYINLINGVIFLPPWETAPNPVNLYYRHSLPIYSTEQLSTLTGASLELTGRIFNIIIGTGIIAITALIAKELFRDRRIAVFAAVLIALSPKLIDLSTDFQRDSLYLLAGSGVLYFLASILRHWRWPDWIYCGGAAGLAFLSRGEGVELLALIVIFGFYLILSGREKILRTVCLTILSFLAFFTVYAVYLCVIPAPKDFLTGQKTFYCTKIEPLCRLLETKK